MKSLYPRITTLIDGLDSIEGARRGQPNPEGDGPGPHLTEEIERAQREISPGPADSTLAADIAPDPYLEGHAPAEAQEQKLPVLWFPDDTDADRALTRLAGAKGEEYKRLTLLQGVDAYAWYVSFHQKAWQWGIYLPITAIAAFATSALGDTKLSANQKMNFALQALLAHERFHFAADIGIAHLERILGAALWWPMREKSTENKAAREHEEQLATAAELRAIRFSRAPGAPIAFRAFVEHSKMLPPGYRDGHTLVESRFDFESSMLNHAQEVWWAALDRDPPFGAELQQLYPAFRPHELSRCPLFVMDDHRRLGLGDLAVFLIKEIPHIEETSAFAKQLRKMQQGTQAKWAKTRKMLGHSTHSGGLDFKPWPPGGSNCFSVRIDRGIRAHLRFNHKKQTWTAESIGNRVAMGHD